VTLEIGLLHPSKITANKRLPSLVCIFLPVLRDSCFVQLIPYAAELVLGQILQNGENLLSHKLWGNIMVRILTIQPENTQISTQLASSTSLFFGRASSVSNFCL
jgi:hypothetical protein